MAYDDVPKKQIEVREGKGRENHNECIKRASNSGGNGIRTDAAAEGVDYLGMDDINRIRRERLNKQTG